MELKSPARPKALCFDKPVQIHTLRMPAGELVSPVFFFSNTIRGHTDSGIAWTMQDHNRQASQACWLTAGMQGLTSRRARLGNDVVVLRLVPQELLRRHAVQLQRHIGARIEGRATRRRWPCATRLP